MMPTLRIWSLASVSEGSCCARSHNSFGLCALIASLIAVFFVARSAEADTTLLAARVDVAPTIDGLADDDGWKRAQEITTFDPIAGIEIRLKAVHTDDEVFLLAQFPDATENWCHKKLIWNADLNEYQIGPTREDTFVIKWSMEPVNVDLSLSGDQPYKADIWYWKAHRTDHAGYADDKNQTYSPVRTPTSHRLFTKTGQLFYLSRQGDEGDPAYRTVVYPQRIDDQMPMYSFQIPTKSRADVRAKGAWKGGVWTVEFRRVLMTGHADDVQFHQSLDYQFGVSRYEIAGRPEDPNIEQPRFGSGEITESLMLRFE